MSADDVAEGDQLLLRAQAGDCSSLGQLLELHRGYLSLLARVQVGPHLQGKFDPADVVQETFLKAHRDFHSFRGTSADEFFAWIRQILITCLAGAARHYLGTQQRDPRLECRLEGNTDQSSEAGDPALLANHSTPSEHVARKEQAARLAEALEQLPLHYREVIVLHNLENVPLSEIARRLGRSDDSVQKIWTRALVRLRDLLREPHAPTRPDT